MGTGDLEEICRDWGKEGSEWASEAGTAAINRSNGQREISGSSLCRKSPVCQAEEYLRKGMERGHQRCRLELKAFVSFQQVFQQFSSPL